MGFRSEEGLTKAYALLEEGKPALAKQELADSLLYDLDNSELKFAVWCCTFWADFVQQLPTLDLFERGEGLISRWKKFHGEMNRYRTIPERAVYATDKGIFTLALQNYEILQDESTDDQKAEVYRKIGFCYKKLGNYANALQYLTEANRSAASSAAIIAEMADCYALCGEEKNAKLLFREAFFIDAQAIDLALLDSELIRVLIRQVEEKKYTGAALKEWIPVYGVLYGVFSIKRQLRSQEVGKLKQDIFAAENELRDPASDLKTLTPKLINMYFWLIDHYVTTEGGRERTNEVLLKIKMMDREIYTLYNMK
ncbi:MAG: hypothetical protein IJS09_07085 [Treponema sp.]|nr:hypothetical protein [Treponema sp.]